MSPEVKEVREESGLSYFVIYLAKRQKFDHAAFDDQARRVSGNPAGVCHLKYIVANSQMFIFRDGIGHVQAFIKIVEPKFKKLHRKLHLRSAGSIRMVFGDNGVQRLIHGSSNSLLNRLPLEESERYKFETLREKLGEFFEFELPHIDVLPNAH